MDSIIKNVQEPFKTLFSRRLDQVIDSVMGFTCASILAAEVGQTDLLHRVCTVAVDCTVSSAAAAAALCMYACMRAGLWRGVADNVARQTRAIDKAVQHLDGRARSRRGGKGAQPHGHQRCSTADGADS